MAYTCEFISNAFTSRAPLSSSNPPESPSSCASVAVIAVGSVMLRI